MTCHLEYRLKEVRHGASLRLKARRQCESLRTIAPASVAVRCVASAGAATSAEPPAVVEASAPAVALAVAEAMVVAATDKKQSWL